MAWRTLPEAGSATSNISLMLMIVKDQFKMRDRIPPSLKEIREHVAEEKAPADRQPKKAACS
jgi:hypothetical protein